MQRLSGFNLGSTQTCALVTGLLGAVADSLGGAVPGWVGVGKHGQAHARGALSWDLLVLLLIVWSVMVQERSALASMAPTRRRTGASPEDPAQSPRPNASLATASTTPRYSYPP